MFNRKAFSLVEIVVVAIVMATLTAIVVPNYINYTQQAAESAAQNNLISVYNAQKTFYLNNGYYCTTSSQKPACGTSLSNINSGLSLNVTDTYFSYSCSDPNAGSDGNNGSTFNCTASYKPNNATPITVILTNNPIVLPGGVGLLNPSSTAVSCTPITSCPLSDHCGSISNNCGGSISCGTCTSVQTCSANQCVSTSSAVNGVCSTGTDHPALTAYPSSYCSTGNIYGNPTTNPATSSNGSTITWTCAGAGGGSSSGTCTVCVPNSCPTTGYACGPYTNSCGGTVSSCGTCPSGQTCSGNTCIACTSSCSSTTAAATCTGVSFADTCGTPNACPGTENCPCNSATIPTGATACSNTSGTTLNQAYSAVSSCGTAACTYSCGCNSSTANTTCIGTNFADNCGNSNVCPGSKICSCSGTEPYGSTDCGVAPSPTNYTYNKVSTCGSVPCSYSCSCPNQSTTCTYTSYTDSCGNINGCTGTETGCGCLATSLPTGATACSTQATAPNQPYTLVTTCGSTPCSYTYACPTGQHFNGTNSCIADTNGKCGSEQQTTTSAMPTSNLCTTGTSTAPGYASSTNASGGTWTWQCQGTGPTGTTVNCYSCDSTTCPTSYNCGQYTNICNTIVSNCAPGCTAGTGTCGGGGTANVCGCSTSIPEATACAGKSCGSAPNGCGGNWSCGTCSGYQTCGGSGTANVCGCTSTITCASKSYNCGTILDNCGNTLNCGSTCPHSYQTCTNNVCSCTPVTSCPAGDNCGTYSACGNNIICGNGDGSCSAGSCVNNVCQSAGQCASPDNGSTNANPTNLCISGTPSATITHTDATSTSGGYRKWTCYGWGTSPSESCSSCMGNCPTSYSCGNYPNSCGTTVNCGTCTLPQTCGGGTNPHACGCTVTTCTPTYACGSTAGTNNCGGSCTASPTCPANTYCSGTSCLADSYNNWCERDSNGQNATLLSGSYTSPGCYNGSTFYTAGQSTSYGSGTITCEVSSSYATNQANCTDTACQGTVPCGTAGHCTTIPSGQCDCSGHADDLCGTCGGSCTTANHYSSCPSGTCSCSAPGGSYSMSCNTCSMSATTLNCSCETIAGTWVGTSLNLSSCSSGCGDSGVSNINGTLTC